MNIIIEGLNIHIINTILWLFAIALKLGIASLIAYLLLFVIAAVYN